ncbi:MAG TPA: DinB family protein [Dehalococcoidia bacterium]|nr:DinB family protein [Dehalococcoidia bacterium]
MNRDELIERLRDSGVAGLAAMHAVPAAALSRAGYENGWTVRQIMAHVASMEFTYRRLPDVARGSRDAQATAGGGTFDMDGYNARQVERRAERSPAELAEEFLRGRAALIVLVAGLDDWVLAVPMRSAGGVSGTLAEVMAGTAAAHVRTHCGDFVRAGGAEAGTGERVAAGVLLSAEEAAVHVEPVPAERWRARAGADAWSAAGISGHLIELLPYWATKLEQVSQDASLPFSRALDAPERLGGVVNGEALAPAQGAAELRRASAAAAAILRRMPAAAWRQTIAHPRLGAVSLEAAAEELLVSHAREHVAQIAAALASAAG